MALKNVFIIKESPFDSYAAADAAGNYSDKGAFANPQGGSKSPLEDGTPERDAYKAIQTSLEQALQKNPNNEPTQKAMQMFKQAMQSQKPIDMWNGANNAWHEINDESWSGGMTNKATVSGVKRV